MRVRQCGRVSTPSLPGPSLFAEVLEPNFDEHLPSNQFEHLRSNHVEFLAIRSRGVDQRLDDHNRPHDRSAACIESQRLKLCGNWFDASLKHAMDAVTDQGVELKTTLRIFGVPTTSLRDHL